MTTVRSMATTTSSAVGPRRGPAEAVMSMPRSIAGRVRRARTGTRAHGTQTRRTTSKMTGRSAYVHRSGLATARWGSSRSRMTASQWPRRRARTTRYPPGIMAGTRVQRAQRMDTRRTAGAIVGGLQPSPRPRCIRSRRSEERGVEAGRRLPLLVPLGRTERVRGKVATRRRSSVAVGPHEQLVPPSKGQQLDGEWVVVQLQG